jgi:CelD/BcsL family acetyltransferase involved in cellulose biosynthesis
MQKEWGDDCAIFHASGSEITLELFTELVELNRGRIEKKGARHLWHPQLIKQRWQLAQECGVFCGLRRGDTLVAGTLSYLHRSEAYFVLIGHNTDYDRLRLGKIVLWVTIKHLIHLGYDRYHLLWGMSAYKLQMGGQPKDLSDVTVFRHAGAAVLWRGEQFIHRLISGFEWLGKIPRILRSRIGLIKAAV